MADTFNPANLVLGVQARDAAAMDAVGAFLVGELERLDPILHEPLVYFTYSRDMPIRKDATIADEYTSFMNLALGSVGGTSPNGKNWMSREGNVVGQAQVDYQKIKQAFTPWAMGASYDLLSAASATALNRPIDSQMIDAVQLKHQMDADEMAYIGDSELGVKGLCNHEDITVETAATGASTNTLWSSKTADEIIADVNTLLTLTWKESALAIPPSRLLLPPDSISLINSKIVSTAGNRSVLNYLKENNLYKEITGKELSIYPVKWLSEAGVGGLNRMVAYTPEERFVRMPMTPLARTTLQYDLLKIRWAYYGRLGGVELVKSQTTRYMDGI